MSNSSAPAVSFNFGGLLLTILIVLKLLGLISISWWWVFSPLWIPLAFIGAVGIVALFIGLLAAIAGA